MRITEENGVLIEEEEYGDVSNDAPALEVLEAKYLEPYKLHITFSDKASRIVDFEPVLREFRPLQKFLRVEQFKRFRLYNGNIQWNKYEMIFPVEELYGGFL